VFVICFWWTVGTQTLDCRAFSVRTQLPILDDKAEPTFYENIANC